MLLRNERIVRSDEHIRNDRRLRERQSARNGHQQPRIGHDVLRMCRVAPPHYVVSSPKPSQVAPGLFHDPSELHSHDQGEAGAVRLAKGNFPTIH